MSERVEAIVDPFDLVEDHPWPGEAGAHGWIQWKGTDVCMDFHCECGVSGHIDAEFAYYIECGACHRLYAMNPHVKAVRIDRASFDDGHHCPPIVTEIDVRDMPKIIDTIESHSDDRSLPGRKPER